MFLPKSLIELELLLPAPLPPALRRFLARRPQGTALGDWRGYPRAAVLERYREQLEKGAEPQLLPIGRAASGEELLVDIISGQVSRATSAGRVPLHHSFGDWIGAQRAAYKAANEQPLLRAARAGDRQRIDRLLRRGAGIDTADADGHTALMAALLAWQYEAASGLLDAGADLSRCDREGHSALMWAAWRNQPGLVQRMIDRGADVHARTRNGEGLLYFAFTGPRPAAEGGGRGSREVVELLLAAGLRINEPQLPGGKMIRQLDAGETDLALWAWLQDGFGHAENAEDAE